ncbi:MAG: DUF1549 domain-containing protein [Verrucomicrobiales bacterium]
MKPSPFLAALVLAIGVSYTAASGAPKDKSSEEFDTNRAAADVDRLVEAGLKQAEVEPNEPIDDTVFIRRTYLDIVGRIPTIEEAENFHGSTYARKREQLVADLLESDGHVSHAYNFWADVLRINTALGNGARQAEAAYQLWLKKAIEENVPYDEFVRELVSATGKVWDNGAVGYYLRDRGMPLDNMSNTVRVFLGTRLECAQCHNHPFDKWTQMDYYQMAAFSYGMNAQRYASRNREAFSSYQREELAALQTKMVGIEKFPAIRNEIGLERFTENRRYETHLTRLGMTDKEFRAAAKKSIEAYESYNHDSRRLRDALNDLYRPLRYVQSSELEKTLKLPHDYQYSDSEPLAPVSARTMFGEDIDLENIDESAIEVYADWMTSKENPTFTKVIANRLWKRVFGHGIFEPLDELSDQTQVANPELLSYLETMMRELDYDMRRYLEVLYNTKTYQRAASADEIVLGEPYHFQGPVLRRMSAEQIWDSIVALALPEADGYRPRLKSQLAEVEKVRKIYAALEERSEEDYLAMVQEVAAAYENLKPREEKVRERLYAAREAEDEDRYRTLRQELSQLQREARQIVSDIGYNHVGETVEGDDLLVAMGMSEMSMNEDGTMSGASAERAVLTKLPKPEFPDPPAEITDRKQKRAWMQKAKNEYRTYTKLVGEMARASELESPARRGHFLREFGQSDREVIENAAYHASVPQALNFLNGPIVESLTNPFAVFGSRVHEAGDADEKIRMIFQAMLTREPTERETALAKAKVEEHGDGAYEKIVWALLNTQQFIFVQ